MVRSGLSSADGTQEECLKHTSKDSCWLMIDGRVYDVTTFLDDHPGGGDILVQSTGKDATDDFEDVGHSKAARRDMKNYLIGTVQGGREASKQAERVQQESRKQAMQFQGGALTTVMQVLLPVIVVLAAVGTRYLTSSSSSSQHGRL